MDAGGSRGPKLSDATTRFVVAAGEGVALSKWGRRYRRRAVQDLESALRQVPDRLSGSRPGDVRRGDVQQLVDDLTRNGLSGSRVRRVVNALRSLYRWAQDRELVGHNPAELVRLPAMDATPRDRVATPAEFASLLGVLAPADALPYTLAGSASPRVDAVKESVDTRFAPRARGEELRAVGVEVPFAGNGEVNCSGGERWSGCGRNE